MTIAELRELFGYKAEIYVAVYTDEDDTEIERFKVKNLLFGTSGFASIDVKRRIKATGENEITVFPDMPLTVFRAWKEYQDKAYSEEE